MRDCKKRTIRIKLAIAMVFLMSLVFANFQIGDAFAAEPEVWKVGYTWTIPASRVQIAHCKLSIRNKVNKNCKATGGESWATGLNVKRAAWIRNNKRATECYTGADAPTHKKGEVKKAGSSNCKNIDSKIREANKYAGGHTWHYPTIFAFRLKIHKDDKWSNASYGYCTSDSGDATGADGAVLNAELEIRRVKKSKKVISSECVNGVQTTKYEVTYTARLHVKINTLVGKQNITAGNQDDYYTKITTISKTETETKTGPCGTPPCDGPECPTSCTDNSWVASSYKSSNANHGVTSTLSKVRNLSLSSGNPYAEWSSGATGGYTYAKPGDNVDWIHCYYPGVQKTYNTKITIGHHPGNNIGAQEHFSSCFHGSRYSHASTSCNADSSYSLVNSFIRNAVGSWSNRFTTKTDGFSDVYSNRPFGDFGGGNDEIRDANDNTYIVEPSKAGQELKETIETGKPTEVTVGGSSSHSWGCKWGFDHTVEYEYACGSHKDEETGETVTDYCTGSYDYYDWQDTCTHSPDFIGHDVKREAASTNASVRVPYNYLNRTRIIDNNPTGTELAGETSGNHIKVEVATMPKENAVTEDYYATIARDVKVKLQVCYGSDNGADGDTDDEPLDEGSDEDWIDDSDGTEDEADEDDEAGEGEDGIDAKFNNYAEDEGMDLYDASCPETSPVSANYGGTLNPSMNMEGDINTPQVISINIPDLAAGSEICVRSAVWPADSGDDTNYNDTSGSHTWAYSKDQVCYTIGKKPSLQVWGGNVFSKGNVSTSVSNKGHLTGYNGYDPDGSYARHLFGSWGEFGVVSSGIVKGFASGAALGYQSNNNGTLWPSYHPANGSGNNANIIGQPGGSVSTDFCVHSPLSFANSGCKSGTAGLVGTANGTNESSDNKESVINRLIPKSKPTSVSSVNFADNTTYYYSSSDLNLDAQQLNVAGVIKVVHALGSININGNITYGNDGYTTLTEVPKAVIYAEGDVNIACEVTQIDALIMADGQVNTCANSRDTDERRNSTQLKVNGAIISKTLNAKRTYGTATGANSIIPAEIINHDPTLYMWAGSSDQDDTVSGGLNSSYIVEVSPRL